MNRIWDKYIGLDDADVLSAAGYNNPIGFGNRPAILVIDANYNFTGDRREPIRESIKTWPNACGDAAWDALPKIKEILDVAHARNMPVFFSTDDYREDGWNLGSWKWKTSRFQDEQVAAKRSSLNGSEINDAIKPHSSDIIIKKLKPSVFNGTPLRQLLTLLKVDTTIIAGGTTSGCDHRPLCGRSAWCSKAWPPSRSTHRPAP